MPRLESKVTAEQRGKDSVSNRGHKVIQTSLWEQRRPWTSTRYQEHTPKADGLQGCCRNVGISGESRGKGRYW